MKIDVVICTHNPDLITFQDCLKHLHSQSVPTNQWRLTIIDNASDQAIASCFNISWHHNGRIIRETKLGLTHARLRGIRESNANLLVFVDDDNLLAPDYLERAMEIAAKHPNIGAFGGRVLPRFEQPPPAWSKPYHFMLALRDFDRDQWGNLYDAGSILPCGAGLCVSREVACCYEQATANNSLRQALGRKGSSLASAEDTDLAFTALDLGLGIGQFKDLYLEHVIPPQRLEADYLLRLWEDMNTSAVLLRAVRWPERALDPPLFRQRARDWLNSRFSHKWDRRMRLAQLRGKAKARRVIQGLNPKHQDK